MERGEHRAKQYVEKISTPEDRKEKSEAGRGWINGTAAQAM
jgi:hypothetical protein